MNEQWSVSERQPMRGCVYGARKVQEMTNSFGMLIFKMHMLAIVPLTFHKMLTRQAIFG